MGAIRAMWAFAACLVAAAAVVSGIGLLYLLRGAHTADLGPSVSGALPLQQLAGGEAQPLARIILAWVPAGLVAGLALAELTRLSRLVRVALIGSLAAAMLIAAGAAADAAAVSDPLAGHVLPQFGRLGTWAAVVLVAACAALPTRPESARPVKAR